MSPIASLGPLGLHRSTRMPTHYTHVYEYAYTHAYTHVCTYGCTDLSRMSVHIPRSLRHRAQQGMWHRLRSVYRRQGIAVGACTSPGHGTQVYTCPYTYLYTYTHIHIHIYTYTFTCLYTCLYTWQCPCLDAYLCTCLSSEVSHR